MIGVIYDSILNISVHSISKVKKIIIFIYCFKPNSIGITKTRYTKTFILFDSV